MKTRIYKYSDGTEIIVYRNRKGTRIEYKSYPDEIWGNRIVMTAESRITPRNPELDWESMPVTRECILATYGDYFEICNRVLKYDKGARKWFRTKAAKIVVSDSGTRLGDFLDCSGNLNYQKIKSHEDSEKESIKGKLERLEKNNTNN